MNQQQQGKTEPQPKRRKRKKEARKGLGYGGGAQVGAWNLGRGGVQGGAGPGGCGDI